MNVSISHHSCTFLLDSQAGVSLIKRRKVRPREWLDTSDIVNITGITDEPISTLGSKNVVLSNDDFELEHILHVVPNDFNIPSDGILGKDFMKKFRCNLDYDSMTLSFWINDRLITIPILESPEENMIVLPARSEVVRTFNFRNKFEEAQLVNEQEIIQGVFVARTIIGSSRPLIRILNATESVQTIRNDRLTTENLSNYDLRILQKPSADAARAEALMKIIEANVPEHAK